MRREFIIEIQQYRNIPTQLPANAIPTVSFYSTVCVRENLKFPTEKKNGKCFDNIYSKLKDILRPGYGIG